LYRENAADLFPRKVSPPPQQAPVDPKAKRRRIFPKLQKTVITAHVARPVVDPTLDLEHFPQQFEDFAKDILTFGKCLTEFPEFNDDSVNASIQSFEEDLKVAAPLFSTDLDTNCSICCYSIGPPV
jgi:hypothetical protein